MAWTKAKTAIFTGIGMLLAAGTVTITVKNIDLHQRKPESDADIAVRLLGTWFEPADGSLNFKSTYYADGHGITLMWPVGKPESTAIRLGISWSVTDGVLIRTITETSDQQPSRIGRVLKTPVVSVSSDRIVLKDQMKTYTIHKDTSP